MGGPLAELVLGYGGPLQVLRQGLSDFLTAEGVDPSAESEGGVRLTDSLLATVEQNIGLDWKRREPLQARLKVACKRVLVQFGLDAGRAENVAERLVGWLRVQAPDVGSGIPQVPALVEGSLA